MSLANQLVSPQIRKCLSSTKFIILIFWSPLFTPLIPCHYHWKGWWPSLEMQQHTEHRDREVLQNYPNDKGKEIRKENIYFHFWIYYCSVQFISGRWNCHENCGLETKSSRRLCQKLFYSFISCVGDINCILNKLDYMNFPCVAAAWLYIINYWI